MEERFTRPKPTRELICAITGGNKTYLSWVHHGLYETPLGAIYPFLNLDELIVFAGVSWRARDCDREQKLNGKIACERLPDYFNEVVSASRNRFYQKFGMSIDDIPGRIPIHMEPRYDALNPFKGDLKERLEHVGEREAIALKEALLKQTLIHVFEDQYFAIKRQIRRAYDIGSDVDVDPERLKIMGFQICRKRKRTDEKIVQAYVNEINRIIGNYPRESYDPQVFPRVQKLLFS